MRILITGGAGFIGCNSADFFHSRGYDVTILDNFSRSGSKANADWLKKTNKQLSVIEADIRYDQEKINSAVKNADVILHLAGQVAVTTSVLNPRDDFNINALGSFNVLESARLAGHNPVIIYSSTNKVYGGLENIPTLEKKTRYEFKNLPFGVSEEQPLDFHSPYGCSKGTADQYFRDYARIYGLNTIVLRQSCIYGPRQFGIEDQGWVAWFIIALVQNRKLTIYGSGKQVRDILYIDDLLNAYDSAIKNINSIRGNIYNIGGGSRNTISIWYEFKDILEEMFDKKIPVDFTETRPGDQPIFVSDIRKAKKEFGWSPEINVKDGIKRLYAWINENRKLFA